MIVLKSARAEEEGYTWDDGTMAASLLTLTLMNVKFC
jgi:hypothetical protein